MLFSARLFRVQNVNHLLMVLLSPTILSHYSVCMGDCLAIVDFGPTLPEQVVE